jgi:large subunit ribosomal protein L15
MKFNELKTTHKQSPKRVGRGIAAGQGKTAGRGTKGYGARTGSKAKPGFAGGQNPIMQALPKLPGFRSHRPKMENVFTDQLAKLNAKDVDGHALAEAGLISNPFVRVKLLSRGELKKAVAVHVQGASKTAQEAVNKAGGSVSIVDRIARPARTKAGKAEAKAAKTTTKKSDK